VVIYTMRGSDRPSEGSAAPGSANNNVAVVSDAETQQADERPAPEAVADAAVVPTGPTVTPTTRPNDENTQFGKCTELSLQKKWQDLDDCATELGTLGLTDKAKEFHAKAKAETDNEVKDAKVRQALKEGNLKEAQAVLRTIGDDSSYARGAHDAFIAQEARVADDARRRAINYANAHDCAAVKRLAAQMSASSTERVASLVAQVKCSAAAAVDSGPGKTPQGPGSAVAVQVPPPPPPPVKNGCESIDVDALMQQASNQYTAGYAKVALAQVVKALGCKQDGRMYRFAVMYACTAHDLAMAKQYFAKAPAQFQPNLEQKCQQEGLNIRGP